MFRECEDYYFRFQFSLFLFSKTWERSIFKTLKTETEVKIEMKSQNKLFCGNNTKYPSSLNFL